MAKSLLKPDVENILNQAIHAELFASNLYKHLANQLQRLGWFGAQKHFAGESADELEHYQKLADYLNDRGTVAKVPAVEAMDDTVTGLRDAIEIAYETEVELGRNYEQWFEASDTTTRQFLLQFIEIQRVSIGEYADLISRLDRAQDNPAALFAIDAELGE